MSFPGNVLLSDKEVLNQTSTQRLPLGTRGYTADGRAFRYTRADSTAIAVGKLCQQAVPDASLDADQMLATSTLYACADYQDTNSSAVYIDACATEVIAADVYKEGYLYINDELGEGQMVRIKDHLALDGTVSVIWKINFADDSRLSATISTATQVGLVQNKYDKAIIRPDSGRTGVPLGVTPRAVTGNYYFWVQTWGPCVCAIVLAASTGNPVTDDSLTGTGTAGILHEMATSIVTTGTESPKLFGVGYSLGNVLAPGLDGEHALIDLRISP